MRRVVLLAVLAVAGLLVLDRVGAAMAERAIAGRIQADQDLGRRPDVSIGGFPFLTQLVAGTYDDVELQVRGLHAGPVPVERVRVHLRGAHVALGDVISQDVSRVPVDRASATLLIEYAALEAHAGPAGLRFSRGDGGRVRVEASAAGVDVGGDVPVTVDSGVLSIAVGHGLDVHVPLGALPFRMHLTTVTSTDSGLVVAGTADGLVLHR